MPWTMIATWGFSLKAIRLGGSIIQQGGSVLDAIEEAVKLVEDDPEVDTVGYGGIPNEMGEVELDAAFMEGANLAVGAIAAIKGYRHPVSIARKVMSSSPHNLIIGSGAEDFASEHKFERKIMTSASAVETWELRMKERDALHHGLLGHDTIGVVALGNYGEMACATSSSGMALKHRGRVGDSPLIGSGFFVDAEVGGATATGLGEDIMKCCTSFYTVELMRMGYLPQQAAEEAVRRTHKRLSKASDNVGNIAVVCADNKGNYGAAANHEGFEYVVATEKMEVTVYQVRPIDV